VFAGLLNKGMRGSLALLITVFLLSAVLVYLAPISLESDHYPNLFYNYFARYVTGKFTITCINFFFIALNVMLVSLIAVRQEVVEKQNYFPVFLCLLLAVAAVHPFQLTPQIFTNTFVFFSIYKLLDTYRGENVLRQVFEAAFWLSLSSFITISSIICYPLFFIILLILRSFYWREWVVALLGFFLPLFLYECMAYLSNFNQWYFFHATELYFHSLRLPSFSEYYLPLSLSLFLLLLVSIGRGLLNGFGNTVKKQRAKSILLWFLFFSSFGFFSGGASSSSIILIYSLPLCFFIGDFLYGIKQQKITNTLLAILLLCVLLVFFGRFGVI